MSTITKEVRGEGASHEWVAHQNVMFPTDGVRPSEGAGY